MPAYVIEISPKAARELAALPMEIRREIGTVINDLSDNPRPRGIKRLQGHRDIYRVRVRDYRLLYRIQDSVLIVIVVRVGNRAEVYKRLELL